MHPVVFDLPLIGMPLRFFGLFIVDAFFFATLWVQWEYLARTHPNFRAAFRGNPVTLAVLCSFVARILFVALPLPWLCRLGGIFLSDVALMVWARLRMGKALDDAAKKDAEFVFSLAFWLLVTGFIGSRLFWIVTTPSGREDFAERPLHALFAIWEGGIVYYGGLLAAAAFGAWYLWVKKGKGILEFGDLLVVGVALTLYIGRWACFSAGCDHGIETDKPWGMIFHPAEGGLDKDSLIPEHAQLSNIALHPTQLYMSLNGLVIFVILAFVLARRKFTGQVVWLFFLLYPLGRSLIEFYRGDTGRGMYEVSENLTLSSSQIISIPVFLVALLLLVQGWRRARKAAAGLTPPPG
jgi:phosphatidylglycerol:prolipoprotein diacylglycerol transferase